MDNFTRISFLTWVLMFLFVGNTFSQDKGNLLLISDVDFSDPGAELTFYPIDSINSSGDKNSLIKPEISIGESFQFIQSSSNGSDSSFINTNSYAIVRNPIFLDSLRMTDNEDMGGILFSIPGKGNNAHIAVMTCNISGLKEGGDYQIEIEFGNPFSEEYLDYTKRDELPHIQALYRPFVYLKMGNRDVNPTSSLQLTKFNSSQTITFDKATSHVEISNTGNLNFSIACNPSLEEFVVLIKRIKIYAEVSPSISAEDTEVCIGGATTKIVQKDDLNLSHIQWYKNGVKVDGANNSTFTHISCDNVSTDEYFYIGISPYGDSIVSPKCTIENVACGVDNNGRPLSRELVWQEDFGTFNSATDYWVWDYSNIHNPKKVYYSDGEKWTMCLDDSTIFGGVCSTSPSYQDKYAIAANVTCTWGDLSNGDGTQWEWEACFGNGSDPRANGWSFVPDHTYNGDKYGGMLFMNYEGEANSVIYRKDIKGLCERTYTAKCFLNIFSQPINPSKIQIQLIDLATNDTIKSKPVEILFDKTSIDWYEVACSIDLQGPNLRLEIVSLVGGEEYNYKGNDFVIDDIQLWTTALPKPTIKYSEKDQNISMDNDILFQNFWQEDYHILYQYKITSDSLSAWENLTSSAIDSSDNFNFNNDILESLFEDNINDTTIEVSIRIIIGDKEVLENTKKFETHSPCGDYAISNIINIPTHMSVPDTFVSINNDEKNLTITWKKLSGSTGYELIIFEDEAMTDSVCIVRFDENGKLISNVSLRSSDISDKMSYTITGLEAGTYYYTMTALNKTEELKTNSGNFTISQTTYNQDSKTIASDVIIYTQKGVLYVNALTNGYLLIGDVLGKVKGNVSLQQDEVYEITLPRGVYIVMFNNKTYKTIVY